MDIKTRHLINQAYQHTLGFALLALAGISLSNYLLVEAPNVAPVVLLPDSALAALLLGLGLLGCANARQRLARPALAALLGIALYSLSHDWLALDTGQGQSLLSGFPRMRSTLALLFCLLAIGLLSSQRGRWGRRLSCTLGLAAISLGCASLLAVHLPALSAWRLGFSSSTHSLANLFGLSMGVALLVLNWLPPERERLLGRSTLIGGALGVLLTCSSWYLLSLQHIELNKQQNELLLAKLGDSVERALDARRLLMQRMAERWSIDGQLPKHPKWRVESSS